MCTVKHITGDGNCLFHSFAYIMTGSEDQHMAVRTAILQHMIDVGHFILGHHVLNYSSIQDYIADTNMDRESATYYKLLFYHITHKIDDGANMLLMI